MDTEIGCFMKSEVMERRKFTREFKIEAVGMVANPSGAHQAGRVFTGPHQTGVPATLKPPRATALC